MERFGSIPRAVLIAALAAAAGQVLLLLASRVRSPGGPSSPLVGPGDAAATVTTPPERPAPLPNGVEARAAVEGAATDDDAGRRARTLWHQLKRRKVHVRRAFGELSELAEGGDEYALEALGRWLADPAMALPGDADELFVLVDLLGERRALLAVRAGLARLEEARAVVNAWTYYQAAARVGTPEAAELLLAEFDGADEKRRVAVCTSLGLCGDRSLTAAWLERVERHVEEPTGIALLSSLLAWRDPQVELSLRRLVQAPELDATTRAQVAGAVAEHAEPELALALVTPYWSARGEPAEAAVHVAAALAVLRNERVPPEDQARVVQPIAEQLLGDEEREHRSTALHMFRFPALASRSTLRWLATQRPALIEAGLRREVRDAIHRQLANVREQERAAAAAARSFAVNEPTRPR